MRKPSARLQQFVVLPTRGLQAMTSTSGAALGTFLAGLNQVRSFAAAKSFVAEAGLKMKADFKVLDSIHENGAKLVEMTGDTAKDLQASQPGLRIVPVVYYRPALARQEIQGKIKAAAAATIGRTTRIVCSPSVERVLPMDAFVSSGDG